MNKKCARALSSQIVQSFENFKGWCHFEIFWIKKIVNISKLDVFNSLDALNFITLSPAFYDYNAPANKAIHIAKAGLLTTYLVASTSGRRAGTSGPRHRSSSSSKLKTLHLERRRRPVVNFRIALGPVYRSGPRESGHRQTCQRRRRRRPVHDGTLDQAQVLHGAVLFATVSGGCRGRRRRNQPGTPELVPDVVDQQLLAAVLLVVVRVQRRRRFVPVQPERAGPAKVKVVVSGTGVRCGQAEGAAPAATAGVRTGGRVGWRRAVTRAAAGVRRCPAVATLCAAGDVLKKKLL